MNSLEYIAKNVIYKEIVDYLSINTYKLINKRRTLRYKNRALRYYANKYNFTWRNERSIEVPIIWDLVKKSKNKKVLELGNVLSHYHDVKHDILDKYEKGPHVINEDVVSFNKSRYDLIVSVSTLEHVGWDERPRERDKFKKAIHNLKSLLNKKGELVFTVPLGYNKDLDRIIKNNEIKFDEKKFMKRISRFNTWRECSYEEVKNTKYNSPFGNGNAVMIASIKK